MVVEVSGQPSWSGGHWASWGREPAALLLGTNGGLEEVERRGAQAQPGSEEVQRAQAFGGTEDGRRAGAVRRATASANANDDG